MMKQTDELEIFCFSLLIKKQTIVRNVYLDTVKKKKKSLHLYKYTN